MSTITTIASGVVGAGIGAYFAPSLSAAFLMAAAGGTAAAMISEVSNLFFGPVKVTGFTGAVLNTASHLAAVPFGATLAAQAALQVSGLG